MEEERKSGQKSNEEEKKDLEQDAVSYPEKSQKDSMVLKESSAAYQLRTMQGCSGAYGCAAGL